MECNTMQAGVGDAGNDNYGFDDGEEDNFLPELPDMGEVMEAKEKNPMMFVSGFEADDDGILPASEKPDNDGERLLDAAEEGNADVIIQLLEKQGDLISYKDVDGYTALHRSCYEHHVEAARLLISRGADVNSACHNGWTPLHSASHWNAFRCVRLLLENGANVNAETKGGLTPLHLACRSGSFRETVTILLTEPGINTDIKSAAGETAYQEALRNGPLFQLFDIFRQSVNKI